MKLGYPDSRNDLEGRSLGILAAIGRKSAWTRYRLGACPADARQIFDSRYSFSEWFVFERTGCQNLAVRPEVSGLKPDVFDFGAQVVGHFDDVIILKGGNLKMRAPYPVYEGLPYGHDVVFINILGATAVSLEGVELWRVDTGDQLWDWDIDAVGCLVLTDDDGRNYVCPPSRR